MHVALIIGGSIIGVGAILYLHHRLTYRNEDNSAEPTLEYDNNPPAPECCGLHITCERDSLSPVFNEEIEYFDDEELDEFINRAENEYSDSEIETFREVLLTLRPEEIAPWSRSIQLRGINLPATIRDELLLIVREARESNYSTAKV